MKCLRGRFIENYFVGITSGGAGVTVSISLNFVSGRSRGASDSPVQQQETEISAIADAQKAEKIRIMESKSKGLLYACGGLSAPPWWRLLLPGSTAATKSNQKLAITWWEPRTRASMGLGPHSGSRKLRRRNQRQGQRGRQL
jgi:hypothetical protein